jgi:hypothetical protein
MDDNRGISFFYLFFASFFSFFFLMGKRKKERKKEGREGKAPFRVCPAYHFKVISSLSYPKVTVWKRNYKQGMLLKFAVNFVYSVLLWT